jgi:myosin-1
MQYVLKRNLTPDFCLNTRIPKLNRTTLFGFLPTRKPPPGGGRPKPAKPALPAKPTTLAKPSPKKVDLAEALYPYEAKGEDELSLQVGDVVRVVKRDPSGWWEGILNSKAGLFPGNYVKEVTP